MEEVEYRELPDYPGYRFGSDGSIWTRRVKGAKRKNTTGINLAVEWRERKSNIHPDGYRILKVVNKEGKSVTRYVHRLILEAFLGPCPEGMEALHNPDRGPSDNRLCNLRWGTKVQNRAEARGQCGKVLLGFEVVNEVRFRLAKGQSQSSIAIEFDLSTKTVYNLKIHRHYRHILSDGRTKYVEGEGWAIAT